MNSVIFRFLSLTAVAVLTYVNFEIWHWLWLAWLVMILFFWFSGENYQCILKERFGLTDSIRSKIFGIFLAVIIFSLIGGFLLVFWRFSDLSIALSMLFSGYLGAFLSPGENLVPSDGKNENEPEETVFLVDKKIYLIIYAGLVIFSFVVLALSRSNNAWLTPWQILPDYYIYLYFITVLLSGAIIFSHHKKSIILLVLVLQFILAFSYLPLTTQYFWGADGWRHSGVINNLADNEVLVVENFSQNPNWLEKINPGIFSYSQFWFLSAVIAGPLQAGSINTLAWLLVILAGIMIPLLLYEIGRALKFDQRTSLFLSWLGLFPFAFQAVGGFSLPSNLGFLFFLFFILLIIRRSLEKKPDQFLLLLIILGLSCFGYALYLILMLIGFVVVELLLYLRSIDFKIKWHWLAVIMVGIIFLIIPILEFSSGQAYRNENLKLGEQLTQAGGNLFGYYLASGPRPHTIETGNIFFNQMPIFGFVVNGLTVWRWWLILFMTVFFIGVFFGLRRFFMDEDVGKKSLAVMGVAWWLNYIILRYLFLGEHILTRRMDAVLAFFALIFFIAVIKFVWQKSVAGSMILILFFTVGITASYSFGPYSRSMSELEYLSAEFIWTEVKNDDNYCVLADTYPLLALEAISSKKIIGGGFPIDQNFAQAELGHLYNSLKKSGYEDNWLKAKEITGADHCYLLMMYDEDYILEPIAQFGRLAVYRY